MKKCFFIFLLHALSIYGNEKDSNNSTIEKETIASTNKVEAAKQLIADFFVTYFIKPFNTNNNTPMETIIDKAYTSQMQNAYNIIVEDLKNNELEEFFHNEQVLMLGYIRRRLLLFLGKK